MISPMIEPADVDLPSITISTGTLYGASAVPQGQWSTIPGNCYGRWGSTVDRQAARTDAGTLIGDVITTIKQRIAGRVLTPGARLPSIRAFAKAMRVSKSTIVEAYERLAAEGIICSRPGSGFYVAGALAPLSLLLFGFGLPMEGMIIAYACTWPILITTTAAVRNIEPRLIEV
jgi:hypothetical protein